MPQGTETRRRTGLALTALLVHATLSPLTARLAHAQGTAGDPGSSATPPVESAAGVPSSSEATPPAGEPAAASETFPADGEVIFDPTQFETIKVTADRREQNIQEVAGSVSAFTQEDLERINVNSVNQLSNATPYVHIGVQEGNTEVYIRGVGSDNNTELGDPAAATHIDDIYIPRPRGVGSMFFDIERVESYRGPQGTLRGRNSTSGSLNIITNKPRLGEFGANASVQLGNYAQRLTKSMVNIPLGNRLALRLASYSENRGPFYKNAGPIHTITPAESADTLAYRAQLLWNPLDRVTFNVAQDYTQEKGTGWSGTNYAPALRAGIMPDEVPDPRAVIYRGPQPSQDMKHWGVRGDLNIDLGPLAFQSLTSYRDLRYKQITGGNTGVNYNGRGAPTGDALDNWSTSYWDTSSKSIVQELRLHSDKTRVKWNVGYFFFNEKQEVLLGTTCDKCGGYFGNEFNMPDVKGRSHAGYADATLDITKRLHATAGVRYTTETKSRTGIGAIYGFWGLPAFRQGTEGFSFAGPGRTIFDPSMAPPGMMPGAFLGNGIANWGARDTFQETVAGAAPGSWGEWSTLTPQRGSYKDTFIDWRGVLSFDITDRNHVYGSVSTGHKSGGFNDSFQVADANGVNQLVSPTYKPESMYNIEVGSKNDFFDGKVRANASAFAMLYKNQQFQSIQPLPLPPGITLPPDKTPPSTAQRLNVAESRILGFEFDGIWHLPFHFVAGAALMVLDARFTEGDANDYRLGYDPKPENVVSLKDKKLPRASRFTVNYSLGQNIRTSVGWFDWMVMAQSRSSYYMTIFNGSGTDTMGNANPIYNDKIAGFTRLDVSAGYARPDGKTRLDAFVTNVTDVTYVTSLINVPDLNLRFFNPPRQMGVRLSLYF